MYHGLITMRLVVGFTFFIGLCFMADTVAARAVSEVRILRVVERLPSASVTSISRGVQERQLTKFAEELDRPEPHQLDVHWMAPSSGLIRPVSVRMLFRQSAIPEMRQMEVNYPAGTRGEHVARFTFTDKMVRDNGPVTAWRVALRVDGRLVEERMSSGWR